MATSSSTLPPATAAPGAAGGQSRLKAILLPSFPEVMFLVLLAWIFAGPQYGWTGLLVDGDTGWHIRTGEYILDHGRVPIVDLFSFSKPGAPWFAWEWGCDVLFGALFRFSALKGIVFVCGVAICLALTLVFVRMLARGVNLFLALLLCGLAAGASSVHYLARPHVFTLLLLSLSLCVVERDRRRESRLVWGLIPLTALWANLHGGFLSLVACLGLLAAGSGLEALFSSSRGPGAWRPFRRYAVLTGACAAVTLLNPYGYHLHVHMAKYLTSDWIKKAIGEFQSPSFRGENILQYEALLLVGVAAAGLLLSRRQFAEAFWVLFWAHMSLSGARHIPVFVIVAVPVMAVELNRFWDFWTRDADRKSIAGILRAVSRDIASGYGRLTVVPLLVVVLLPILDRSSRWPTDFPPDRLPVKAVNRYQDLLRTSRVLTGDQWADYLIYRSYPQQKVYVDGRSDFYGPEVGQEYLNLLSGRWDWRKVMDRRGFDVALVPPDWPLATLLKDSPEWRLVQDDGVSILFIRKEVSEAPARLVPVAPGKNAPRH
jgi:hypothetical protein